MHDVVLPMTVLAATVIATLGGFAFLIRTIAKNFEKSVDDKFKSADASRMREDGAVSGRIGDLASSISKLSSDVHRLEKDMPREFVRREDYVQALATVNAKIDSVAAGQQQMIYMLAKVPGVKND